MLLQSARAEPPPETTTVRLPRYFEDDGGCWAALYIAGELLRAEGFTDVRYVQGDTSVDHSLWIAGGETDFDLNMPSMHIASIDAGVPIKVLTGLHTGCFELIANDSIRSLTDLRGKRVGVYALNDHPHVLTQLMVAYVGLDPKRDIQWVTVPGKTPTDLFIDGKIDAFLAGDADAAGPAGAQDRPHDPQQCRRSPMVAVFLLHDRRQRGLREQISGGDQACPAGHPQGRRPLRVGSAIGGAAVGRSRLSTAAMTTRSRR